MTAEVVVLNREAVAIAADSAVTLRDPDPKIYNTANKLFQLSALEPVAIMVYGSAAFGPIGHHDESLVDEPVVIVGRKGNAGAVWYTTGPSWPIDTTYFLRIPKELSVKYLGLQLDHLDLVGHDSSTTIPSLRRPDLEAVTVAVAPLAEQERIVATIEEHFSRLDAVEISLDAAEMRCHALTRSIIVGSIPSELPKDWQLKTVAEAGETGLGRQRSPKYHSGPNMKPYLRVANVFEDRIDTSSIMEMHFEEAEFDKYRLRDGDVLLNEGQSPELLGRPAIYRGEPPGVAFTNSLIRFVTGPGVMPEWALLVFRRHMHAGRFMWESRITTNIAHLALGRFRTVEFPIPPLKIQQELVAATRASLSSIDQTIVQIQSARAKANGIRRAVLAAAFSGQLVPQDPSDEHASLLLERIAASRSTKPNRRASARQVS